MAKTRVVQTQQKVAGTRRADLDQKLVDLLEEVGTRNNVYFEVYSGGQNDETGYKGSVRHDHGKAADLKAYQIDANGNKKYITTDTAGGKALWKNIASSSIALGATGIGMAEGYMGSDRMHIGFGNEANHGKPASSKSTLVWGAGGSSKNAPKWLVEARDEGLGFRKNGMPTPQANIGDVASSTDNGVAQLQQQLADRGFNPGAIDGIKGAKTTAAVKAFQKANGLAVDGIVGPKTMAALQGQRQSGSLESALGGVGVPAAFGVRATGGGNAAEIERVTRASYAPGDLSADNRLMTLGRPAGNNDPVGNGLSPVRAAVFAPQSAPRPLPAAPAIRQAGGSGLQETRFAPRTLGGSTGSTLGFKPLPAPAPLVASAYAPTPRPRPVVAASASPAVNPWQQMASAPPVRSLGAPTQPAASGGGFNIGGLFGGIGNKLGQATQNIGSTLGNTATAVVKAAPAIVEKAATQTVEELMKTPSGRGFLINQAMGVTPALRPEQRSAERVASAPEGYGYGTTGKTLYKIGQRYNSSRGPVVFNGKGFEPAAAVLSSVDIPPSPGAGWREMAAAPVVRATPAKPVTPVTPRSRPITYDHAPVRGAGERYTAGGDDMSSMPLSVQTSSRWNTGY